VSRERGIALCTARRWVDLYRPENLAGLARKRRSDRGKRQFSGRLHRALALQLLLIGTGSVLAADRPYPRSEMFRGIEFHADTLVRKAPGSDIWSCTWADDGNLYAAWGDGGGFGGTDSHGRVSIGVAAIQGNPPNWNGVNVWGGREPRSNQKPTMGKGTMIAAGGALYVFVSEQGEWNRCRLWKSANKGISWQDEGWIFPRSHKVFAFPGLVQHGQDNRLSSDGYIYGFSDNDPNRGQDKRLYLFRVKPARIATLEAYEYFSGTTRSPAWSAHFEDRKPVFENPEGISWGTTCVYHPASRRYLLSVTTNGDHGDWGLYEGPNPWGPWKTVAYGDDLPEWTYTPAEKNRPAYLHTFPAKWISPDGATLWCVFDRGDHFNLARCRLVMP
jgi:hypothetical protein